MSTNNQQVGPVNDRNITDSVLERIDAFRQTGAMHIPKDYSPQNALKAAWLILQDTKNMDKKPVLEVCTRESIANALLKMVVQGLNPVKRQCSFIAYGNQLNCQREYAGTIAVAKRDANVKSATGAAIFEGDVFEFAIDPETLEKRVIKHEQTIESMGSQKVKGAYAVITFNDGSKKIEVMAMPQIQKAWEQGPTKGQSPAHKNFPDQMAIKTVIGRALKIDVNSSDDSSLLDDEEAPGQDEKSANVQYAIDENSNKTEIGFDEKTEETTVEMVEDQHQETLFPDTNPGPGF